MSTVLVRDWLYIGSLQLSLVRFVSASAAAGGNGSAAQPYQRITQGLTGAAPGTIVFVFPGSYSLETWPLRPPSGVLLLGAGPDVVTVDGSGTPTLIRLRKVQAVEISNLTLRGSGESAMDAAIDAYATDTTVVLRNLIVTGCRTAVRINEGTLSASHLSLADNTGHGIAARHVGDGGSFSDNIVAFNALVGVYGRLGAAARAFGDSFEYSDFFGNGTLSAGTFNLALGTGNLLTNPLFRQRRSNFALKGTSPARDAGDPALSNNDPDGTRGDMGAFGGSESVAEDILPAAVPSALGWLSVAGALTALLILAKRRRLRRRV